MKRRARRVATIPAVILALAFVAAAPALAQGLETVEPTLDECRAFVEENGVPESRPVWENRGYSGWDVCLNMAYDGDLEGAFAAADANGDGRLDAGEQSSYLDTVIGPVSDPDRTPLTLEKCAALISAHGIPAERPFVDWSNRGYEEVEVCQSLAFGGDLGGAFTLADANADGRLDRTEQSSHIASLAGSSGEAAQDASAAQSQYENTGAGETTTAPPEPTTSAGIPSGADPAQSAGSEETTQPAEPPETAQPAEPPETTRADEPEKGVLSAVNDFVERVLPSTGGVRPLGILGVLGGAALIAGGLLAYRFLP